MSLEEFTHQMAKARDSEPRLGVQRRGRVSINIPAMAALGQPTHVVLLFDADSLEFGVRAASPDERHSYRVNGDSHRPGGNTVSALALWAHFRIDYEKYSGSYRTRIDGPRLVIKLVRNDVKPRY